VPRSMSA